MAEMYSIAFTPNALDDIAWFRKRERRIILVRIEGQLSQQPDIETRNRKRLRPNENVEWELRIERYRVFYDVDLASNVVEVKMIGYKEGNTLFIRGKEFNL